uniref:Capsid protein n=1 Tax=Chionoecetes opilio bacilliform virus TaxID=1825681 RepID=A0A1Q3DL83_9VIRU|nr:wsv308-like protein [Chionoecetes opilio bacilliform virus]GAV93231.1 capsid protein [Chionoecetes opilio bacilliform virus]
MNAVDIIEGYMKSMAEAVLRMVESVENMQEGTATAEEAAKLMAIAYGSSPKPTTKNVAALVCSNNTDSDISLSISAARYGMRMNRLRADASAIDISNIMDTIISTHRPIRPRIIEVHVGMTSTGVRVDCSKYSLNDNDDGDEVDTNNVITRLQGIFGDVEKYEYVEKLVVCMTGVYQWSDQVAQIIRKGEENNTSHTTNPRLSLSSREVRDAVRKITELVGSSFGRTVTQLTTGQELSKFKKATCICYQALMANTREQVICDVLFNVCFKRPPVNAKDKIIEMSGGRVEKEKLERRSKNDILYGLCFLSEMLPSGFLKSIWSVSDACHGGSSNALYPLLSHYYPRAEEPWHRFKDVIEERERVIAASQGEKCGADVTDAVSNLTGLVYVLVSDVAYAYSLQRTCTERLVSDVTQHCNFWTTFIEAEAEET